MTNNIDYTLLLPPEVIQEIASHCDRGTLGNLAQVNCTWKENSEVDQIWEKFASHLPPLPKGASYPEKHEGETTKFWIQKCIELYLNWPKLLPIQEVIDKFFECYHAKKEHLFFFPNSPDYRGYCRPISDLTDEERRNMFLHFQEPTISNETEYSICEDRIVNSNENYVSMANPTMEAYYRLPRSYINARSVGSFMLPRPRTPILIRALRFLGCCR